MPLGQAAHAPLINHNVYVQGPRAGFREPKWQAAAVTGKAPPLLPLGWGAGLARWCSLPFGGRSQGPVRNSGFGVVQGLVVTTASKQAATSHHHCWSTTACPKKGGAWRKARQRGGGGHARSRGFLNEAGDPAHPHPHTCARGTSPHTSVQTPAGRSGRRASSALFRSRQRAWPNRGAEGRRRRPCTARSSQGRRRQGMSPRRIFPASAYSSQNAHRPRQFWRSHYRAFARVGPRPRRLVTRLPGGSGRQRHPPHAFVKCHWNARTQK